MRLIRTLPELADYRDGAFVPTMGALHAGHAALIDRARSIGTPVLVSVFVNPTQFAPGEDLASYPRRLEADCELARRSGADAVFAPDATVMYPPGQVIAVPPLPAVATQPGLEEAHRPTHFAGVCQVVARLLDLVKPRWAIFGEKDYQQLLVIQAMVKEQAPRWGDLEIIAHPTVREPDGLALSSRNAYLKPDQREQALALSRALDAAKKGSGPFSAKKGPDPFFAEKVMRDVLTQHGLAIDYAVVRDAATLMPISRIERPARALIAARLGPVRLIDNAPLASGPARSST